MFSFFRSSKKSSPVESPEASTSSASVDDFVILTDERTQRSASRPGTAASGVYPSFGPTGAVQMGTAGVPATSAPSPVMQRQQSEGSSFSYLHGVPFKLSSEIRVDGCSTTLADRAELWRIEVDQILANMTRALNVCND